jgi:hypothetical protein
MQLKEIIKRKKLRVTNVVSDHYLQERGACDLGQISAASVEKRHPLCGQIVNMDIASNSQEF